MQMRPPMQIQAIIKALTQDVVPALDQSNQLAMQSAQLAIGTLALIAQHLPLEFRYDCDELGRLIAAAETLRTQMQGAELTRTALDELAAATRIGRDVLSRARAEPAEILEAIRRLRTVGAQAVRTAYLEGSETTRKDVATTVLSLSKSQLLRDRSWLLMQGWEPDPTSVPPIDELLPSVPGSVIP
jgi:hypothetical protein